MRHNLAKLASTEDLAEVLMCIIDDIIKLNKKKQGGGGRGKKGAVGKGKGKGKSEQQTMTKTTKAPPAPPGGPRTPTGGQKKGGAGGQRQRAQRLRQKAKKTLQKTPSRQQVTPTPTKPVTGVKLRLGTLGKGRGQVTQGAGPSGGNRPGSRLKTLRYGDEKQASLDFIVIVYNLGI